MITTNSITRRKYITTIALALALACFPGVVQAATYNIANGDVSGLIAALQTAYAAGGSNTINLAAGGNYTLTAIAEDTGFFPPSGLPGRCRGDLTINGNGAIIQRSTATGTPSFGIMGAYGCNLTLDGVTLMGGSTGGLVFSDGGNGIIRNSTITQNSGAGILNYCANLAIVNSTVSYNTSESGYGGGGILNFSHNCPPSAKIYLSFSTIFENQSATWSRGYAIADYFSGPGSIVVKNSILASPMRGTGSACYSTGGDITVVVSSLGHNIVGEASCGFTGIGDMTGTDPLLGALADNGGLTPTHLPFRESPAIDAVPLPSCTDVFGAAVTTDQRGASRPQGAACDIGSVDVLKHQICLLYNSTKAVQSGATIPIKFDLCDSAGNDVSSPSITVHAVSITQTSTLISGAAQASGNANPDNDFRFDSTLGATGGYIFNLSTKGLSTGSYNLDFIVTGNSFVYAVPFQVK